MDEKTALEILDTVDPVEDDGPKEAEFVAVEPTEENGLPSKSVQRRLEIQNAEEPVEKKEPELTVEQLKALNVQFSGKQFHTGTPAKSAKKRGVGITRKSAKKSKSATNLEKSSRSKNQKIAKKVKKFSGKNHKAKK